MRLSTSDSAVTERMARPPAASMSSERTRRKIGLGRLLRGTDQAVLTAFCIERPRPSAP